MSGDSSEQESLSILDVLNILLNGKLIIISSVLLSILIALIVVAAARPIYEADSLIQVEDEKPALSGLSELTEALPSEGSIGAELQILQARSVLGEVVDRLALTKDVERKYFPVVGEPLERIRRYLIPSELNHAENGGVYDNGLDIGRFEVQGGQRTMSYRLRYEGEGDFLIYWDDSAKGVRSNVGRVVDFIDGRCGCAVQVLVRTFEGKVGDEFILRYKPTLVAINELKERLSVYEVGRDTGVMRLRLVGGEPGEVARTLDEIANTYLRQNVERKSEEAQKSLNFLSEQLPVVRGDLEAAENKLAEFREKNQTIDLTIETESVLTKMVDLDRRLSELELKKSELKRTYTGDHPLLATIENQRLQLQREREKLEGQSSQLPDVQQELLRLVREVEVSTELYTFLLNKTQELKIVEAGTVGNVRILDAAAASPEPVAPNAKLTVLVCIIIALITSAAFVILMRILRRGIIDPDEVEATLGVPIFAVLPHSEQVVKRARDSDGLATIEEPESVLSESFRSFRTSLHFAIGTKSTGSVIAISGPAPNVGKTFVAANLAVTLARAGHSVLFVDADMRRGDASKKFGIERTTGLSGLLASPESEGFHRKTRINGLSVLPRGKSPPNPAELLMSENFQKLLGDWRKSFDFVVVDSPPVLAVTDPVIISRSADIFFLVGRAARSTMHEMIESKRRFEKGGVNITGVVINGMKPDMVGGGKYGYGYSYLNYEYKALKD